MSLFGPVGVRHVEIKFLSGERCSKGFQVVLMHPDHTREIDEMERTIHELTAAIREDGAECGANVDGDRHHEGCIYDLPFRERHCPVTEARRLRLRIDLLEWTSALLDYFWQHRAQQDGIRFFEGQGFIHWYTDLAYDRFTEAEEPYGRPIKAIELVYDWKVKRVLWTVLVALVCDIGVVAVSILLTRSLEVGLSAGSYAAAMQTILLALLTLLSAVLA